ncbi:MAG: ABC transporter permease, partial [Gammaproteobacteria bacterium]|nr:ABC transporter permease [Gammaproteobacteria bacterium]
MDSLYIAWKYLNFSKARTATLVACVTLIAVLPLALQLLLAETERQLLSRAASTPLLLGAPGSALDLVMNGLYFDDEVPELISMAAVTTLADSGLASPIPLYVRFKARRFPIVGTTLDYFDFRGLALATGRPLALLGECVVGAEVAERLDLKAGDSLLSSPETVFDLAGVYPLNMKVAGVLARAHTPDDLAVFVDIKTAWVVEGLVHGHQDLRRVEDAGVIIEQTSDNLIANAKLVEYTEITPGNIESFHFHGAPGDYPLSALITVPNDAKSATILRGRYLDGDS